MKRIMVQAAILKHEIAECAALIGLANNGLFTADGKDYPLHALVYRGFAGAIDLSDGMYRGHHTFERVTEPCVDEMDFNELPGLEIE